MFSVPNRTRISTSIFGWRSGNIKNLIITFSKDVTSSFSKRFWFAYSYCFILFGTLGKCTFFHHESFDYEKPGNDIIPTGKWTFFLGLRLKSIVLVQWASVQKITLLALCARLPWFFTQYAYTTVCTKKNVTHLYLLNTEI